MPWFKLSDDWLAHRKVQRAGKNGRALWIAAGNRCAAESMDGLIEGDLLKAIAALADVPLAATARKLVEVEMWHDSETIKNCAKCRRDIENINRWRRDEGMELIRVTAGNYYSHDWAFHQLSARRLLSPEARMAEDRLKALHKDPGLTKEIQSRDGSLCRYCGERVNWRARKGDTYATYDHRDPFCYSPNGGNFLEAINTSCGNCNGEKGQRTIAEWVADGGHTEKPPGWRKGDPDPTGCPRCAAEAGTAAPPVDPPLIYPGSDPDLVADPSESDSGSTSSYVHGHADAPLGPGQEGPGLGVGPGRIGLVGAGAGLAGLVRAGQGGAGSGAPPGATPPEATTDASDGSTTTATDVTQNPAPGGATP